MTCQDAWTSGGRRQLPELPRAGVCPTVAWKPREQKTLPKSGMGQGCGETGTAKEKRRTDGRTDTHTHTRVRREEETPESHMAHRVCLTLSYVCHSVLSVTSTLGTKQDRSGPSLLQMWVTTRREHASEASG